MFTYRELGDRWSVSRWSIYRMVQSGQLHPIKVGGSVRFSVAEVEKIETGK